MPVDIFVTCSTTDCQGMLYIPKDGTAPHPLKHATNLGWTAPLSRTKPDLCPACRIGIGIDLKNPGRYGGGPVLELGSCDRCHGKTSAHRDGDRCQYCLRIMPDPDDDEHQDDEEHQDA